MQIALQLAAGIPGRLTLDSHSAAFDHFVTQGPTDRQMLWYECHQ
jgi:hypothetical protein